MNKVPENVPEVLHGAPNYYLITLILLVFFFTANWMYTVARPTVSPSTDVPTLAEVSTTASPLIEKERATNRNEQMLSDYFVRMGMVQEAEKRTYTPLSVELERIAEKDTPSKTVADESPSLPQLQTEIHYAPKVSARRNVQFLLYPRGGERFCFGQDVEVTWDSHTSEAKTVDINLVAPWGTVRLESVANAEGSYTWHIAPIHVSKSQNMGNIEIPASKYYALALEVETPFMPGNNTSGTFAISNCK